MTTKVPVAVDQQNGSFTDVFERAIDEGVGVEHEAEQDGESIEVEPFDPTLIRFEHKQVTADLMLRRIREGEIDLQPEFQRMAGIWDEVRMSRLIESMMLRIPLPAFYIDASDEEKWIVIDGLQRLTTISRFMDLKDLALRRLEFWQEFNGATFDDLPRKLQRRLEETQLMLYLVQQGTPHKVKFNIFRRINTGGMPLSGQEIRHALNQGASTELLKELAQSNEFQEAVDGSVSPKRMTDRECVLRYLAFKLRNPELYSPSDDLDSFLNDRMQQINKLGESDPDAVDKLRHDFKRAMIAARCTFGHQAFRKYFPQESRRMPVSKALFEVWSVNLDRLDDKQVELLVSRKGTLLREFARLMEDNEFMNAISYSTGDSRRVHYRFKAARELIQEALGA
ncbi:MAG: DUF262 domain-containing protein [Caldilineaceae bacterium]|nr:DUF262 domain-containing protein [Caldilineaceae bacterium]